MKLVCCFKWHLSFWQTYFSGFFLFFIHFYLFVDSYVISHPPPSPFTPYDDFLAIYSANYSSPMNSSVKCVIITATTGKKHRKNPDVLQTRQQSLTSSENMSFGCITSGWAGRNYSHEEKNLSQGFSFFFLTT